MSHFYSHFIWTIILVLSSTWTDQVKRGKEKNICNMCARKLDKHRYRLEMIPCQVSNTFEGMNIFKCVKERVLICGSLGISSDVLQQNSIWHPMDVPLFILSICASFKWNSCNGVNRRRTHVWKTYQQQKPFLMISFHFLKRWYLQLGAILVWKWITSNMNTSEFQFC